jgi:hypothetical protein
MPVAQAVLPSSLLAAMRAVALDASVAFAPSAKRSPPEEETLLVVEAHPSMFVVLDAAAALGPSPAVLGPSAV